MVAIACDSQILHCTLQNCVFFAISTEFLFNLIHDEWTRHHVAAFLLAKSILMTHQVCFFFGTCSDTIPGRLDTWSRVTF